MNYELKNKLRLLFESKLTYYVEYQIDHYESMQTASQLVLALKALQDIETTKDTVNNTQPK